jgi:glucose-6-phosphate isomerase, archaeal
MSEAFPLVTDLELATGLLHPGRRVVTRRLSEMAETYEDHAAAAALLASGQDPVIYEAYESESPDGPDELVFRTTVIQPGTIGDEYFMTFGHHHVRDSGEFYLGLAGHGQIIMQSRDDRALTAAIPAGRCVYVPAGWCHRTINDGAEPFVFLAVYFADAGHDYASMAADGFVARLRRGPDGAQWSRPLVVAGGAV